MGLKRRDFHNAHKVPPSREHQKRYIRDLIRQSAQIRAAVEMEGGLENLQAMREQPWIKKYVAKQQRWLLFLRHCAKCRAPEGQCFFGDPCTTVKELWRHILTCGDPHCQYPRCLSSRDLLKHHHKCTASDCPVCSPVKQLIQMQRRAAAVRELKALKLQESVGAGAAGGLPEIIQHLLQPDQESSPA